MGLLIVLLLLIAPLVAFGLRGNSSITLQAVATVAKWVSILLSLIFLAWFGINLLAGLRS